ncbi:hypothetical protein MTR_8g465660 [Medicago truncatula]|uniref:Retrovirus-related Pol polyprotein from transposon TNT 1-94-like beta-barrel domain-containing protein n=1 Tax=Medicago truncatula TaxID=3880 RepID=A0A072TQ56_MEDTR|nr:hypothetical protein MTR_8g465660 [Medicago truncatula]
MQNLLQLSPQPKVHGFYTGIISSEATSPSSNQMIHGDAKSTFTTICNQKCLEDWRCIDNHKGKFCVDNDWETSSSDVWYFDSGCSRNITGKKYFFENLKTCDHGTVIFGDGNKGRVQGTGNICSKKSPKLEDMLLVKGLVSNLISISQLCDQGLEVKFDNTECFVTNQEGMVLMREKPTSGPIIANPDETLVSNTSDTSRKLGLEDLNDAIDSTENMDIDAGNETKVHDSVDQDPDNYGVRKNVGSDVETFLDQPKIEANFDKSVEDINSEEEEDKLEKSQRKQRRKTARLKSNKGIYVVPTSTLPKNKTASVAETPKSKTKTTGVGPKKGWSKVSMMAASESLKKRKANSSSESEYEVKKDALNVISSDVKKSIVKKGT